MNLCIYLCALWHNIVAVIQESRSGQESRRARQNEAEIWIEYSGS